MGRRSSTVDASVLVEDRRDDPITVLHVDDEPGFSDLVAAHLEREDSRFSVVAERSAEAGLEYMETTTPDCVVSDYDMPGTNGLELLEAVRTDSPDLPFILFTGKGSEEIASDAISAGVSDYLRKDTGIDQYTVLANRIRNAVERYRAVRELERAETRYRRLVEQNLTGIYILQNGVIEYVNPRGANVFGYEQHELIGTSALNVVDEGEQERLKRNLEKRETGEVEELNYRLTGVRKDGERFTFEVHSGRIQFRGEPAVLGSLLELDGDEEV
jgi:PAS domain S-box-containing protein